MQDSKRPRKLLTTNVLSLRLTPGARRANNLQSNDHQSLKVASSRSGGKYRCEEQCVSCRIISEREKRRSPPQTITLNEVHLARGRR